MIFCANMKNCFYWKCTNMNDSVGKETWIQCKCSSILYDGSSSDEKFSLLSNTNPQTTSQVPKNNTLWLHLQCLILLKNQHLRRCLADVNLNEIIISPVAVPQSQVSALFKYMTNPLAVERWHVGSRETVCATELSVDFLVFLWVPMGRLYNSCESNFSTANEQECIKSLSVQSLLYSKTTCFLAAFIAQNDVCPRPDTVQTFHISLMAN